MKEVGHAFFTLFEKLVKIKVFYRVCGQMSESVSQSVELG